MKDTLFGITIAVIILLLCFGAFLYLYKRDASLTDIPPNDPTAQYNTTIVAA